MMYLPPNGDGSETNLRAEPTVAGMGAITIWPVDSLVKIFRDDEPGPGGPVTIEAARNEYENGQFGLRCSEDAEVTLSCSPLQHESRSARLQCRPRFVGYVWVRENVRNTPAEEIVHPAPGEFPDYLIDDPAIKLEADRTQPVWLTVYVPESSAVGTYRGRVGISAAGDEAEVEVDLVVHPATVPAERSLLVTNWINPSNIASFAKVEDWSDEHWKLLKAHATSMANHRQNVILTPLNLIQVRRHGAKLSFDFERFDRWVGTFQDRGVDGLIEGGHLGGRSGNWESGFNLRGWSVLEGPGLATIPPVPVESDECKDFLSQLLPALQQHLTEKGWLDRYVQHLADEPVEANAESYRHLAQLVGRYAPGIRRIDANMTPTLKGCLEIWVPVLDQFDRNMDFYKARMEAGEEVWFYTCLGPTGHYPNRFIDFTLLKVRLLHWINFRYGLAGYLHWGYNHWTEDPYRDTQPDWSHGAPLPAGDQCIVYPGESGPVESIRFDAMRDGIEDYELLRMLSRKDPDAADGICRGIVETPTDYARDPARFREARSNLLSALDGS